LPQPTPSDDDDGIVADDKSKDSRVTCAVTVVVFRARPRNRSNAARAAGACWLISPRIAEDAWQQHLHISVEPHDTEWKSRAFEVTEPTGFKITATS
jgi:hypothetical protein